MMNSMSIPCAELVLTGLPKQNLVRIALLLEVEKYNLNKSESEIVTFSDRELNIISELYLYGGTSNSTQMEEYVNRCYDKKYTAVKSSQSVRNVLTKARDIEFVKRKSANNWKVIVIPDTGNNENLIVKCFLTDYAIN